MIKRIHYKDLLKLVEEDVQAYGVLLDNVITTDYCNSLDCRDCDHFGVCDRIFRLTFVYEGNYKDLNFRMRYNNEREKYNKL